MYNFKKKTYLIYFCLISMFFVSQYIRAEDSSFKIGFVDFEEVFNSYKNTREENQKLQRYKENKEKEAQKLINDINKLKAEAEILSEDAKRDAEKEIRDKLRSLRDFTEDSKKELLDERNVIFQKITDEIRKVIEKKGAAENFTLILDDKALFYKKSAFDLTKEIIEIINDDTKKDEFLK